ncbi:MAG: hypothetical protein H6843_08245 [Rhodospirillaceae bacterium]|nr:hypothetical protein [Rhodospirillaceae bacterium]
MFRTLAAAALGISLVAPALPVLAQQPDSVPVSPGEVTTEIALTELLNELFQMGFVSELNSIERVGSSYIVDVTTIDFERVRLELNAVTGTISQL